MLSGIGQNYYDIFINYTFNLILRLVQNRLPICAGRLGLEPSYLFLLTNLLIPVVNQIAFPEICATP